MKKAAQIVREKYNCEMPKTYQQLLELPRIGEYTAGAIASIAYDEPVPAVDGNVLRVVSRVVASQKDVLESKTKKEFTKKLQSIMPKEAGDFNQGLMELGERICLPNGEPLCRECPLHQICLANKEKLTDFIPVRNSQMKRRQEQKTVFLLQYQNKIAIRKRLSTGLLANLYEFPNVDKKLTKKELENVLQGWNLKGEKFEKLGTHHHIFSHIEWDMVGYQVCVNKLNEEFIWVEKEELWKKYPIPGAFAKFREMV